MWVARVSTRKREANMKNDNYTLFKYIESVSVCLKNPLDDKDLQAVTELYAKGLPVSEAVKEVEWLVTDRVLTANKNVWDN